MRFYAPIQSGRQKNSSSFAMKTKCRLFILFIFVLSFSTLSSTADTHKSTFIKGKNPNKLNPKRVKPTEDRKSAQRTSDSAPQSPLVTPSARPAEPKARIQSDFAYVPDVSVTCSTTGFVVRVKPAFYGLGADAQELTVGSSCKSNGVVRPQGDLLFTYPVTACDGVRELPPGYLVYKYVLRYEPSPKRFPSKAHQISVNIECHYQRDHSVHQLAVQPTWETVIMRKKLKGRPMDFQINILDDSWRTPAKSQVYLLGQTVNIQVSAPHLPPGLKLYINSCYATPSSSSKTSLKYTMIDNFGCMVDSKHDPGASQFVSRTDNTLRFSLRAFQFTADPEMEISIHCKLSVTSEDPAPAHKSCTYQDHRWRALTGRDSICECCESTCVTSKPRRALLEGFARSGPLLVSGQPHAAEDDFQPVSASAVSGGGENEHNINLYTDTVSHEKVWERLGVEDYDGYEEKQQLEESKAILELLEESDVEELDDKKEIFEKGEVKNLNIWEAGLGYEGKHVSEAKNKKDEIMEMIHDNRSQDNLIHQRMHLEQISEVGIQRELKPADPEEGNEKMHACRTDRRRMQQHNDKLADEEEKTWVFKWK